MNEIINHLCFCRKDSQLNLRSSARNSAPPETQLRPVKPLPVAVPDHGFDAPIEVGEVPAGKSQRDENQTVEAVVDHQDLIQAVESIMLKTMTKQNSNETHLDNVPMCWNLRCNLCFRSFHN